MAEQLVRLETELEQLRQEGSEAREGTDAASAEARELRQQLEEQLALVAGVREELEVAQARSATLQEQLQSVQAERDERERSTAQLQAELKEARQGLEEGEKKLRQLEADAGQPSAATAGQDEARQARLEARIATLEEQLEQARSEAEELRTREMVMREEVDKLRAETEVAQGLAELQGDGAKGELEQSLAKARQEVQIAVRLRTEAEEGRRQAEQALQRLQESTAAQAASPGSVVLPDLDESLEESLPSEAARPVPAPESLVETRAPVRAGGGLWLGAVLGLVLGLVGAGGGYFLLQSDSSAQEDTPSATAKTLSPGVEPEPMAGHQEEAPAAAAPVVAPEPEPVVRRFADRLSGGGQGPEMVELRAAEFEMGSGPGSPHFDERPRHAVRLEGFAIARQEVSFADYDRFAAATGRSRPDDMGWGRGSQPVINVSWEDARAYAEWLSQQTGQRYRLPTEAEWEYAARGGEDSRYWWGNDLGAGRANCHGCGSRWDGLRPAPVGSFPASPYGLQELNGNVQEWMQDCYQDSYRDAPADGRAVEAASCSQRVVRGGGYASAADSLRSAARGKLAPDSRLDHVGFRVVRGR